MMIHTTLKHLFPIFFATCFIVALTSCGGGGSGGGGTGTSSSSSADSIPNAFTFAPITNAAVSTEVTSAPVTVSGINQSVSINVIGGSYSIGGGAFTSAAGTITNGQVVTVKVKSSDKTNTPVTATLTVGGVSATFTVTTLPDVTPDTFTFTPVTGAGAKAVASSNEITVTGIDISAPISITNGEYSINGGAYTTTAGTVNKDQKITVRATSSDTPSTDVTAVLTIGGVTGSFVVTTKADNAAPTAQILFPPPVSKTEGNTILVRGSATDEFSAIASVKVNGVAVTPKAPGDFSSWTASVLLTATSDNDVIVATEDVLGNKSTSAAKVMVRQALAATAFPDADNHLTDIAGLVIDQNNGRNRLLALNYLSFDSSQIIAVDLSTAQRTVVATVPKGYDIAALHPVNHHLYVFDSQSMSVLGIDTNDPTKTSSHSFEWPNAFMAVSFNSDSNLFALIDRDGPIVTTNDSFSETKVLDDVDEPDNTGYSLAFDKVNHRYLKSNDRDQAIFAIDATSGARTVFSSNTLVGGEPFRAPFDSTSGAETGSISAMVVDDVNKRVLVAEGMNVGEGKLFSLDLATGYRTLISMTSPQNSSNQITWAPHLLLAGNGNYALWADTDSDRIIAIDVISGARVVFSQ